MRKTFFSIAAVAIMACTAAVAHAAENFEIWNDATFTTITPEGVLAISQEFDNNSGKASLKVAIVYEEITPANSVAITAVVEEEIAPGTWVPFAIQFEAIEKTEKSPRRIINVSPDLFIINPSTDVNIGDDGPSGTRVSNTNGVLPEKYRIVLRAVNYGTFTRARVTASGQRY